MTQPYDKEAWKNTRRLHLLTYPECRICGDDRKQNVVVHHIRYRGPRGKSERCGDLLTLCKFHHDDLHRQCGRTPSLAVQMAYIRAAGSDEKGQDEERYGC